MNEVEISVIVTAHAEKPHWIRRALRSIELQENAPPFEVIIVCDRPTDAVMDEANAFRNATIGKFDTMVKYVEYGDLGTSRNQGVENANGRYVCFLDADDLFGNLWLRQAYDMARELWSTNKSFVLHNEFNVFHGDVSYIHQCIDETDPTWDLRDTAQFNPWSALAFMPKGVAEAFPYFVAKDGYGYEDFDFHMRTIDAGVLHRVVKGSVHGIRKKNNPTSMAQRYVATGLVIPATQTYDRRDLPRGQASNTGNIQVPEEFAKQVSELHHEVGEKGIILTRETPMKRYPHGTVFDEQALLRDAIGDAKHVVLVDSLVRGGAEKYAIDWAHALPGAVIVETGGGESPWTARAEEKEVRVIAWKPQNPNLHPQEVAASLQRALIQARLESLLVCNSKLGWTLLHENAQPLAQKVFAASFATIPVAPGFTSCPPFYLREMPPNMTIVTDNPRHAKVMSDFNGADVEVIYPKCDYAGQTKLSRIEKKSKRVLWAGRGSFDKRPQMVAAIAAIMPDVDFHVWGEMPAFNAPENCKLRGPFDGFENIDGVYDAYLMTSINEGCPSTAMEATLAGLPVIAPNVGALADLTDHLYDPQADPTEVTKVIGRALAEPARTEWFAANIKEWSSEFADNVLALVLS